MLQLVVLVVTTTPCDDFETMRKWPAIDLDHDVTVVLGIGPSFVVVVVQGESSCALPGNVVEQVVVLVSGHVDAALVMRHLYGLAIRPVYLGHLHHVPLVLGRAHFSVPCSTRPVQSCPVPGPWNGVCLVDRWMKEVVNPPVVCHWPGSWFVILAEEDEEQVSLRNYRVSGERFDGPENPCLDLVASVLVVVVVAGVSVAACSCPVNRDLIDSCEVQHSGPYPCPYRQTETGAVAWVKSTRCGCGNDAMMMACPRDDGTWTEVEAIDSVWLVAEQEIHCDYSGRHASGTHRGHSSVPFDWSAWPTVGGRHDFDPGHSGHVVASDLESRRGPSS